MNKFLIGIIFTTLFLGLASAQATGSFGEYASPGGVLVFSQASTSNTWVLYDTYTNPINFYINTPTLNGLSISATNTLGTQIMSGTTYSMPADSSYPITITVSGSFPTPQTANIIAYMTATASTGESSQGATIQLATSKMIEILGSGGSTTSTIPQGVQGSPGSGVSPVSISHAPPVPISYASGNQTGYLLENLSQTNSETLSFNNGTKTIHLTVNYITPTDAGITANNNTYNLTVGVPVTLIDPVGYTYYAELKNLSYLPIGHTVSLLVYGQPNIGAPSSGLTSITTTASTTTMPQISIANTTTISSINASNVSNSTSNGIAGSTGGRQKGIGGWIWVVVGIVIVIALIAAYLALRGRA